MVDKLDMPLHVGDRVIYTTGGQGNSGLEIGEILEIDIKTYWNGTRTREVALIKTATGRKASNWRDKDELISIQYHSIMKDWLEEQQPELFV